MKKIVVLVIIIGVVAASACKKTPGISLEQATLQISADRKYVKIEGEGATITVVGYLEDGKPIPDQFFVMFETTLGSLSDSSAVLTNGKATIKFRPDDKAGVAEIRAMCWDLKAQPYPLEIKVEDIPISLDNEPPTADFDYAPLEPAANQNILFDGSLSVDNDGTIESWEWNLGDGSPLVTGETVNHTYSWYGDDTERSFTVRLTVTDNDGAVDTKEKTITVREKPENQSPEANFTYSQLAASTTVTFDASGSYDSDGTIVSWKWDFGDDSTGTGEKAVHSYSSAGTYVVTLTVADDQGSENVIQKTITVT